MDREIAFRLVKTVTIFLTTAVVSSYSIAQSAGGGYTDNISYSGDIIDGQLTNVTSASLPESAFSYVPADVTKDDSAVSTDPFSKIHPRLDEFARNRPGHDLVQVVIIFNEDIVVPKIPFLDGSQPRSSDENRARLAAIKSKIDEIKSRRASGYASKIESLNRDFGIEAKQTYWLINGISAEISIAAIRGLSQRPDVVYIQPEQSDDPLPTHGTANHVSNGRARISSDPFFNLGLTSGYIGLLDSGVRETHSLLSAPSRIDLRFDCTVGSCDPNGTTTDVINHGTSSAAILAGNNNMTYTFRGVTGVMIDSYNVYGNVNNLNVNAAVLAFQEAVNWGDRVLVAEMQATEAVTGAIATAADNAFDADRIIVAANGNFGPNAATVRSPALAHKVIGVGAEDVVSTTLESYSGRGPTTDGRIKPDVLAPTNTLTASNAGDIATRVFSGTSGATPYAGGAAMLLSNWLSSNGPDAGYTYAMLVAFGNASAVNEAYNNNRGAGRIVLSPPSGASGAGIFWGKVNVTPGLQVDISVPVPADRKNIDLAIWWPESAGQAHNNIDLRLLNPSSAIVASSTGTPSIFEKVNQTSTTSLATGTWRVRINGTNVQTSPQTVYWALRQF